MGRTLETYRILLEGERLTWIKRTKKTNYEKICNELFKNAQNYSDASSFWSNGLVKEKILFSILFSQYKLLKILDSDKN